MPDENFLAFQYSLGLLDEKQKQAIKRTENFEKALFEWQLHLNKLNVRAPLEKQSAETIWHNINNQIQPSYKSNKPGIIDTLHKYWHYVLSGFASLGILLSVMLVNQTTYVQLGWDIDTDLSKQKILATVTTHQHTDETTTCKLWIKQGDKILLIGSMPETGKKTFAINEEILAMLENGEMIISFEDKDNLNPTSPTIIDYQGEWKI